MSCLLISQNNVIPKGPPPLTSCTQRTPGLPTLAGQLGSWEENTLEISAKVNISSQGGGKWGDCRPQVTCMIHSEPNCSCPPPIQSDPLEREARILRCLRSAEPALFWSSNAPRVKNHTPLDWKGHQKIAQVNGWVGVPGKKEI